MFFEPGCRGKLLSEVDFNAAIDSVKFSSKSEPSSIDFGANLDQQKLEPEPGAKVAVANGVA